MPCEEAALSDIRVMRLPCNERMTTPECPLCKHVETSECPLQQVISNLTHETNLDLVQFPRPVYIHEIRIIPLGTRVQADFPGGHRLGATNPSEFKVEFFVNDLSKRTASTFERLGSFEYKQNSEIQFITKKIPTDGLVLRGWYSAITLAVYGIINKITREPASPPPPPPPQVVLPTKMKEGIPKSKWKLCTMVASWLDSVNNTEETSHRAPDHERSSESSIPLVPLEWSAPGPSAKVGSSDHPEGGRRGVPHGDPRAPKYGKSWAAQNAQESSKRSWETSKSSHAQKSAQHQSKGSQHSRFLSPPDSKDRYTPPLMKRDADRVPAAETSSSDKESSSSGGGKRRDSSHHKDHEYPRRRRSSSEGVRRVIDRRRPSTPPMPRPASPIRSPRPRSCPKTPPMTPPRSPCATRSPEEVDDNLDDDRERTPRGPRTPKEEEPDEPESPAKPSLTVSAVPPAATVIPMEPIGDSLMEDDDLYENITPDSSPDHFEAGFHEEPDMTPGANVEEDDDFEAISSEDEPYLSDEIMVGYDDSWKYLSPFDPFQCELSPLKYFKDPSLTPYEIEKAKWAEKSADVSEEALKVFDSLSAFTDREHTEKWVEAMENAAVHLSADALVELFMNKELEAAANILLDWVEEGLSVKAALGQPQPAYKVRHMKAGIRLATVLFLTDKDIVAKMLDRGVPEKLLELFMAPYMSLPLKLQIVRALDAATYGCAGMQVLFTRKVNAPPDAHVDIPDDALAEDLNELYQSKRVEPLTGYQILLKLLFLKQSTRATVALTALLKKLHLYDLICKLRKTVDKIAESTKLCEVKKKDDSGEEYTLLKLDADYCEHQDCSGELDKAAISLDLLCRSYRKARKEMAQPLRYLPAQSRFEAPQTPFDPYPALFKMFKENHLLEMLCVLASSPLSSAHTGITSALRELLAELLKTSPGMLFLLSDHEATNCLHRALLQDESGLDGLEDTVSHQVGIHLVYHLQALKHIDFLLAFHTRGNLKKELDDSDVVSCLHDLYTIIFSDVGRSAVIDVLAMDRNMDALIPFLKSTGDREFDIRLSKSVCSGYSTELVLLTVHNSDSAQLLQNYAEILHKLSQQELPQRLQGLAAWMEPTLKLPSYNHESVGYLMGCVKAATDLAASLPPMLITALRILQYLGLPPQDFRSEESDDEEELKYKYVIMQIFANNGLSSFLTILQKISEEFLKPWHGSASLVGQQGALVVAVLKPVVNLLQFMLGYLISCRGTEFKDTTAVPVMLHTFTLLGMIPPSSPSHSLAQKIAVEVIELLLAYTQPQLSHTETEEALNKSLWTQMISEVLKFTMRAPCAFLTGLVAFSELLPLPLPLNVREPLHAEDIAKVVNSRKLWSAHLHCLSSEIQEIVGTLSYSTCSTIQQLFRRVCIQLSDLTAPSASVVARALLDAFHASLVGPCYGAGEVRCLSPQNWPPTSGTLSLFDHLLFLLTHPPFKMALLHAFKCGGKYMDIFNYMLTLFNLPSDKQGHIQVQECILTLIQAMCDTEISLAPVEGLLPGSTEMVPEASKSNGDEKPDLSQAMKRLVNSLPSKDQLNAICLALVQHLTNSSHSYRTVLLALRILIMLTEHDFGFYAVKTALDKEQLSLWFLFERLSTSFSKDSSDFLSSLSASLQLLRSLSSLDGAMFFGQLRTLHFNAADMANHLAWERRKDPNKHPLQNLHAMIMKKLKKLAEVKDAEEYQEELKKSPEIGDSQFPVNQKALRSLIDGLEDQMELLGEAAVTPVKEVAEPVLPTQDGLSAQFASRIVYVLAEVDERRLNATYWLSAAIDDTEQEPHQVEVDLVSMMERTLPDFNLNSELDKLVLPGDERVDSTKSPLRSKRKSHTLMGSDGTEPSTKKPFIAPMRGRGLPRASLGHQSRANDPFRSRPPNTSRPPSTHVDDFVHQSHQRPPGKDIVSVHSCSHDAAGGAMFDVARPGPSRSSSTRLFSPPSLYSRREHSRMDSRDFGPFGMGSARSGSMVPRAIPTWSEGRASSAAPKGMLLSSNVVPLTEGPSDSQSFGRWFASWKIHEIIQSGATIRRDKRVHFQASAPR
ncbi:VIR_N domain-containing protein isoform X5 [Rhipicephalus microplus]|uniref:VIR_N domain-containing protein isoform X5 n=1 Tax=Rhipicephalus microplus TaxID=6941 RepID=UPI003F6C3F51